MDKFRLFISIEIPPEIKEAISSIVDALKEYNFDIKWTSINARHLTLAFLGKISEDKIPQLKKIIDDAAANNFQITAELNDALDYFGEISKPRVLWVGFKKGKKELISISGQITELLLKNNYTVSDKEYIPHLTLGRFKSAKNVSSLKEDINMKQFQGREFKLMKITLYKSEQSSLGHTHTKLYEAKLKTL